MISRALILINAACTLVGTPLFSRPLAETPAATGVVAFDVEPNGSILIPPGGYAAIGASIAGPTAGLLAGFVWEEIPQ